MGPFPEYPFQRSWTRSGEAAVIGSAFDPSGALLSGHALAALFKGMSTEVQFVDVLRSLNGQFAVFLEGNGIRAAAVDRIRSIPLLYQLNDRSFDLVTAEGSPGREALHAGAAASFAKMWCTPGNLTLHRDVCQLQAGQYLWAGGSGAPEPLYYAYHLEREKHSATREELAEEAVQVTDRMASRMIRVLDGRPAVVPLSGGYDSRLILSLLHARGYPDIRAYTYGHPGGHEVKIARTVCRKLDIPWELVPYDAGAFQAFFTERWASYSRANHFYASLPHEQDFFALCVLKDSGWLPEGFAALPGFCGDILGGSITAHRPPDFRAEGLERFIRNAWLQGGDIELGLDIAPYDSSEAGFLDAFQHWYVCHKESKFVVNGVRVFEYFGGDWHLPLWDLEFQRFWYGVPYRFRQRQSLYNEVLFKGFFKPLDIAIYKPGFDDNYPPAWRSWLRRRLPSALIRAWKQMRPATARSDVNSLSVLNEMICRELKLNTWECPPEVNDSHAIYFLQNLNK